MGGRKRWGKRRNRGGVKEGRNRREDGKKRRQEGEWGGVRSERRVKDEEGE